MYKIVNSITVLLYLCLPGFALQAQNSSVPHYNPNFFDQERFLIRFEEKANQIQESENFLTVEDATKQLIETEGRKTHIKKVIPGTEILTENEIHSLLEKSTVVYGISFDCGNCDRSHINPASGYVIDEDGLCVTNYHVIESYTGGNEKNLSMQVMTHSGEVYPVVEIVSASKSSDLAVVRVDTRGDKLLPLPFGEDAAVGDEIFILSNPQGMLFYFSSGIVTRNYLLRNNPLDFNDVTPEMQVSADYAVGSSGGPIVDRKGNLVATVSTTRSIYSDPREKKNIQMVAKGTKPVILLRELVQLSK
mgnify:CR=1 FL=1